MLCLAVTDKEDFQLRHNLEHVQIEPEYQGKSQLHIHVQLRIY